MDPVRVHIETACERLDANGEVLWPLRSPDIVTRNEAVSGACRHGRALPHEVGSAMRLLPSNCPSKARIHGDLSRLTFFQWIRVV